MADELNETIILDFEVDQGQAVKDLERTESAILDLKKQQQELNKEYRGGKITQTEYVRENIKLQQSLKKESDQKRTLNKLIETESNSRNAIKSRISALTKEYDNLNTATAEGAKREKQLAAELTKLNAQITKTSKNAGLFKDQIGNYPQAFQQAASEIKVAGVSVADLGTKLAALANPVTATIGILGALTSAYASSTIGAKDLEFAQTRISYAFSIANNSIAEFISSNEEGKGIISAFVDELFDRYLPGLSAISDLAAKAVFELQKLELAQLDAQRAAKNALDEAESLRRQRDDETTDLETRLIFANSVQEFIDKREAELVKVQNDRLNQLNFLQSLDKNNLDLKKEIKQTEFEIADIQEDSEGKRTEALNAIITLERELLQLRKEQALAAELARRKATGADEGITNINAAQLGVATADETAASTPEAEKRAKDLIEGNATLQLDVREKLNADLLKLDEKAGIEEIKNKNAVAAAKIAADEATVAATAQILGSAAGLFNESTAAYKILASAQTLISTYTSAQLAFQSLAGIPFIGPALGGAAAALAIAQGLQRVATINGVEFFDGGYTGAGPPRQAAGVVHRDEYVTPSKVVNRPEAQPHLQALERMRGGYFDGGFVTNQNTSQAQQAMIMANALRNMPAPVVSVVEINRGQKRVAVRETQARI